jgi:glutamate transport system substrate-binding protein
MAKIAAAKSVNIGVDFSQPPFGQQNLQGNLTGFDIDIATYIAHALGIPDSGIHWVQVTPSNREPYLEQGKVDYIAAAYAIEAARQKVVGFAGPYLNSTNGFLVKKGNPENLTANSSFAGKKICAAIGSDQVAQIKADFPKAQLVTFDVETKCVTALENGQVDAFGAGVGVLAGDVEQNPGSVEILPGQWGTTGYYGIGIQKADTSFCQFIDSTLEKAQSSGFYAQSWSQTFGPLLNPPGTKVLTPVPSFTIQPCSTTAPS